MHFCFHNILINIIMDELEWFSKTSSSLLIFFFDYYIADQSSIYIQEAIQV